MYILSPHVRCRLSLLISLKQKSRFTLLTPSELHWNIIKHNCTHNIWCLDKFWYIGNMLQTLSYKNMRLYQIYIYMFNTVLKHKLTCKLRYQNIKNKITRRKLNIPVPCCRIPWVSIWFFTLVEVYMSYHPCSLPTVTTRNLLILKTLPYIIILPTAILPIKYWVSAQYLWKINTLMLNKYSSAYIAKNCQNTRRMTGQETGHPHTYRSAGGSSHAVITS